MKGIVVWLRGVPEWIVTEMTAAFHGVGGLPLEDLHYRSATAFEMIPYVEKDGRTCTRADAICNDLDDLNGGTARWGWTPAHDIRP